MTKEDGLAPRALNPGPQSFIFTNLKTGAVRETGFPVRRPESHAVQSGRSRTCFSIATKARGTNSIARGRSAPTAARCALMHKRTMDMEINGHEWWSWNGKTVWFDLQTPRSQVFWIAGVEHCDRQGGPLPHRARLVGRALQQLAGRHAVCERRRRSVTGRLLAPTVNGSTCSACSRDGT